MECSARPPACPAGAGPRPRVRSRFMPMRSWLQEHTGVVSAVLLCLAGVSVILFFRAQRAPVARQQETWFYDLGDGKLYTVSGSPIPPAAAPSKKTAPDGSPGGVRAHVFACGNCADASARFVGYLETY